MHRLKRLAPLIAGALFLVALAVLYKELRAFHYREVVAYLETLHARKIAMAIGLTAASYLLLTLYDVFGLHYVGKDLPYRRISFASFVGYALNNSVGLYGLVGTGFRYRLYTMWGLGTAEVAKVLGFAVVTFWLGFMSLGGLALLFLPLELPETVHLPIGSVQIIGAILVIPPLAYLAANFFRERPIVFRSHELPLPGVPLAFAQIVVSTVDWFIAGLVLYTLLPPEAGLPVSGFLGAYMLAQFLGLFSSLPGGVGVFEATIVVLLTPTVPASSLLAALLAFRAIYYLLPLLVAAILVAIRESHERREAITRMARDVRQSVPVVVPQVFAALVFIAGAILLFSSVTPSKSIRLDLLRTLLPLPDPRDLASAQQCGRSGSAHSRLRRSEAIEWRLPALGDHALGRNRVLAAEGTGLGRSSHSVRRAGQPASLPSPLLPPHHAARRAVECRLGDRGHPHPGVSIVARSVFLQTRRLQP